MPESQLEHTIEHAASQFFRLVLLVGEPGSGKTDALRKVSERLNCPLVNLNRELSKKLVELTRTQRSRQVQRLFGEVVASATGDVVLLDNLEILFDTALEIAPLRLLQVASRNRTVVATWNGTYRDGTLTYAEPGHPEFMQFKQVEAVVVTTGTSQNN